MAPPTWHLNFLPQGLGPNNKKTYFMFKLSIESYFIHKQLPFQCHDYRLSQGLSQQ